MQVLVKVIKPYTKLKIEFVANVLGISNEEVRGQFEHFRDWLIPEIGD